MQITTTISAEMKIQRATTTLILDYPFFGSCALGLEFVERKDIPTAATDGKHIFWNRKFIDGLTREETVGLVVHEILHVVFKHMLRIEGRQPKRWNVAADYAINEIITKEMSEMKLPAGGLLDSNFDGFSAEKNYNLLSDQSDKDAGKEPEPCDWGGVMSPTNEDGSAMSESDQDQMEASINQKIMMAGAAAKSIGKLPSSIDAMITEMQKPQVDFSTVLKRHFGGDQPDDYTFRRPNRRIFQQVNVFAPSIGRVGCGHVTLVIDTSGSMSNTELEYCLSEINNLSIEFNPELITVITFDTKVQTVREYTAGEEITDIQLGGRGGTDILHVFDYIAKNDIKTDVMIFLTDMGFSTFPPEPHYPFLWVNTTGSSGDDVPFGDMVNIKIS